MIQLPTGKGLYMWQLINCAAGSPGMIAAEAQAAGLGHVLIKLADGAGDYNISANIPAIIAELRNVGVSVWGWQYVYGRDPVGEANKAAQRIEQFLVDGFVIDAEVEYKTAGPVPATSYCRTLRAALGDAFPLGLSSYRYPVKYHRDFPWEAFREWVDFDMPQVYWEQAHNPVAQLTQSYAEFASLYPALPYIPTGSAYARNGWQPTPAELSEFMLAAESFGAVNFWSWQHAQATPWWDAISVYDWPEAGEPDPPGDPGEWEDDFATLIDATQVLILRTEQLQVELAEVKAMAGQIIDLVKAAPGDEPPDPDPEEPDLVNVRIAPKEVDKKHATARFIKAVNDSGYPIMAIYPSDTSESDERVHFDAGEIIRCFSGKVRADGGGIYWRIYPAEYPSVLPQLYLRQEDVVKI